MVKTMENTEDRTMATQILFLILLAQCVVFILIDGIFCIRLYQYSSAMAMITRFGKM